MNLTIVSIDKNDTNLDIGMNMERGDIGQHKSKALDVFTESFFLK